jgi:hypothetical protein
MTASSPCLSQRYHKERQPYTNISDEKLMQAIIFDGKIDAKISIKNQIQQQIEKIIYIKTRWDLYLACKG